MDKAWPFYVYTVVHERPMHLIQYIPAALPKLEAFISKSFAFQQRLTGFLFTTVSLGAEGRRGWKERGPLLLFNPLCTCAAPSLCASASWPRLDSFRSQPKHLHFAYLSQKVTFLGGPELCCTEKICLQIDICLFCLLSRVNIMYLMFTRGQLRAELKAVTITRIKFQSVEILLDWSQKGFPSSISFIFSKVCLNWHFYLSE